MSAPDTLERAVHSILNQSYQDFELIIIANGSDSHTLAIIDKLKSHQKISIAKLAEANLAGALNLGISQAQGPLIARMDADDYAHPDRLQLQVAYLDSHPEIGVVSCLVNHISDQQGQQGYAFHVEEINSLVNPRQHWLRRFVDSPVAHPSVMVRRSVFEEIGLYSDFDGPEDYELWLRALDAGVQFAKVEQSLLDWYDFDTRLSRVSTRYRPEVFFELKAKFLAKWFHSSQSGRPVWIWGYGKSVFEKSASLAKYDISVAGYIDLRSRPGQRVCIGYSDLEKLKDPFILVYVSDRFGKKQISQHLDNEGYVEGQDYLLMV